MIFCPKHITIKFNDVELENTATHNFLPLQVNSYREFANSWTVSECTVPIEDEIPCQDDATQQQAEQLCIILSDDNGKS